MDMKQLLMATWYDFSQHYRGLISTTLPYIVFAALVAAAGATEWLNEGGYLFLILVLIFIMEALIVLSGLKYLYQLEGERLPVSGRVFANYLICAFLVGSAALIGLFLLVLPGLIILSLSFLAPIFLLKFNQGPVEAISSSFVVLSDVSLQILVIVSGLTAVFWLTDYAVSSALITVGISGPFEQALSTALTSIIWLFSLPLMVNLHNTLLKNNPQPTDDEQ